MAENWFADTEVNYDDDDLVEPRILPSSSSSSSSSSSLATVKPIVCLFQDNQATSIKLNSFRPTLPSPVQSPRKIIAAADSSISSASSPSSCLPPSSSSPSINLLTDLQLKNELVINSTPNGYYKINGFQSTPSSPISAAGNDFDKEWCIARGRQLDDILIRLNELRRITKDETKEIQAMKDKTIRLIDTYSSIIVKTNEYLHKWDRKYGSIIKSITSNRYDGQEEEANYFYY